jgi:hypothetical protein
VKIKTIWAVLCIFVVISVLGSANAFAEDTKEYSVEEAGLTFSLPSSMKVITPSTPADSELYKTYKASPDELKKYNVYLQGYSEDNTQVFSLMINQDDSSESVYNYNLLDEQQLEEIRQNYSNEENCTDCTMDKYNDVVYFDSIIKGKQDNTTTYMAQADTVVNGKYVHFVLQSTDGELSQDDKAFMVQVLQSAKFQIESDPVTNNTIFKFVVIISTALVIILVAVLVFVLIKKKKKKSALNKINDNLYNQDKINRENREYNRRHRNTATGAERPDAFFDGVDGLESSENIDKLEKELINEAHRNHQELLKEQEFFENTKLNEEKKKSSKNKSSRKRSKNNNGSSSRKF